MKIPKPDSVDTPLNAVKIDLNAIPKHQMDALCRVIIHSATEAFKNPAFVAEYEEWLKKRYGEQPPDVNP